MSFGTVPRRYGAPAFHLSVDQVDTIVNLLCQGADCARSKLAPCMKEIRITRLIRKAMRRLKRRLGLTALEIHEEYLVDTPEDGGGRIDIVIRFRHQFGHEDAYVAVECKRVEAGNSNLNGRYIREGLMNFVTGKYSEGHERAFMMGYLSLSRFEDTGSLGPKVCVYGKEIVRACTCDLRESNTAISGTCCTSDAHIR